MINLTIDQYKNQIEPVLLLILRLAFKQKHTAADLAALAAIDGTAVPDGALCYVTAQQNVYIYSRFSHATPLSPGVIAPTTLSTQFPGARWIQSAVPATFGPNWRVPLTGISTGVLKEVELFTGQGGEDEKIERVWGATPSMLIEVDSDRVKPISCGYPGSWYRVDLSYLLTVYSDNNRAAPYSSWGSPAALNETADPGPSTIIGQARKVLAGLRGEDLGLYGVDRVEIGDSYLIDERFAERFLVWGVEIRLILYINIPDEDLDPFVIDVQPNLANSPALGGDFDPLNYVASGYEITAPQNTLAATPTPGTAMIAGVAVMSTSAAHTFAAQADTYRDLSPDGIITYTAVDNGHPPPAQADGTLRMAYTTTDATGIVKDTWLCSYSQIFKSSYQVAP